MKSLCSSDVARLKLGQPGSLIHLSNQWPSKSNHDFTMYPDTFMDKPTEAPQLQSIQLPVKDRIESKINYSK